MKCPRCGNEKMKRSAYNYSDFNLSHCYCECVKCGTKIKYSVENLKRWCA